MITEDYVSFEVAKLLKEKGFNELTYIYYNNDGDLMTSYHFCGDYILGRFNNVYDEKVSCAAPTHQMTLKWLREVHKYLIVVGNKNGNYLYLIKDLKANTDLGISNDEYINYEEAVEAAIEYCLTNLI